MYINMHSDIIAQIMGQEDGYIWKLKYAWSNLIFLVRFGVSMLELDQCLVSEYIFDPSIAVWKWRLILQ